MLDALHDMRENGYSEDETRERAQQVYDLMGADWNEKQEARIEYVYGKGELLFEARFPKLKKSKDGSMSPDRGAPENYYFLIGKLGITARYNIMFEKEEYSKNLDLILSELQIEAMRYKLQQGREIWISYLKELAYQNKYHPIKSKIKEENTSFDSNHDYIKDLVGTIKTSEPEIFYKYLRKWLVGSMAKIYSPKGAQNLTLVLRGPQGVGKSRWLEHLVKDFEHKELFGENHLFFNDKDMDLIHLRKFIFHIPELEVMFSKREQGELKNFITKNKISIREAYNRGSTEGYSRCSFCASVNNKEFLADLTGNRRYLICEVDELDASHNINMINVFKQAKKLFEKGEKYWYSMEEIKEVNERNEKYLMKGPLEEAIDNKVASGDYFMTGRDIINNLDIQENPKNFAKLKQLLDKIGIIQCKRKGQRGYMVDKERLRS